MLSAVCELPLGQNTLGLLFFGSPTPLSHPYILRDPPLFAPSAENTHMYQLTALAEVVDVVPSVCVCGDCISGKMSKSTLLLFPSRLSRLPLILTRMPTYTPLLSPPPPLLSMSTHSYAHTLLAHGDTPPPVAGCLHMPALTPAHE